MKHNWIRCAALVLAASSMLSLCACGSGESSPGSSAASASAPASSTVLSEASGENASSPEESSSAPADASSPASLTQGAVEDFVNSAEFQDELSKLNEELSEDGIQFKAEGQGDKMILTMVYSEMDGEDAELIKSAADLLMGTMEEVFQEMADELKSEIGGGNPMLTVVFEDGQGNQVTSKDYTPKAE